MDKKVEIAVFNIRGEQIGHVYADSVNTALMIISHPLTLSGNFDAMDSLTKIAKGLDEFDEVEHVSRSRRMSFTFRKLTE